MRRIAALIAVLAISGVPGRATAERESVLGQPCAAIDEAANRLGDSLLGSTPVAEGDGYDAFYEGRIGNHPATLFYACRSGSITEETISIYVASIEVGWSIYHDWTERTERRMGPPATARVYDPPIELQHAPGMEASKLRANALWSGGGDMRWVTLAAGPIPERLEPSLRWSIDIHGMRKSEINDSRSDP